MKCDTAADEPLPPRKSGKRRIPIAKLKQALIGASDMDRCAIDVHGILNGNANDEELYL